MHKILVRLPMDRDYAGLLEVQTPGGTRIAGPYEVCGRADDQLARDHRNPERNPLLPFGDIPYGEYWVAGLKGSGAGTEYASEEYGPAGVVMLEPRNGDAALADANGRFRFLIHGGKPASQGGLRPTDGSLRLSNRDQRDLVGVLRRLERSEGTCLVVQADHLRTRPVVTAPAHLEPRFARIVSALSMSNLSRRSRTLAVFWLRAMMGATYALVAARSAFGFSLSNTQADPAGNLRSALLAKGASSGLSGRPNFARGRLYAQAGGDYTQEAPEEQAPAPAPQEQAPAAQEPGTNTNAMQQLQNAEQSSQQAAQNPSLEGAHEQASQPFDQGGQPAPAAPPVAAPAPAPVEPTPQEETPAPQDEEQQPEEETPAPEEEQTPAPEEQQAPEEETPSAPEYQAPTPAQSPAPVWTAPPVVSPREAPAVQPTESRPVQPAPAVPFGQRQGARPQPQPAPAAPPGWQGLDDIDAVNALAAGQWRFTPEQRRLLNIALQAGRLRRAGNPTQDQAVIAVWRNIEARGQDRELSREATNGPGLGFAGAGTQSFNDCAIFALSNAAGRPYGVVAASAGDLLRDATWRDAADRAHPQTAIEQGGLSMPEVIMLSQNFGRGTIVESGGFAASLRQGHPIVLGVAMEDGNWSGGHMVAITGTFQHNGETWYVMMDSNQGPMTRRFLSARELDTIRETNGLAFSPNPGQTPQLLRR